MQAGAKEYKTSVAYPASSLAEKLKQVAQLIDAGLETRVYYVHPEGRACNCKDRRARLNALYPYPRRNAQGGEVERPSTAGRSTIEGR